MLPIIQFDPATMSLWYDVELISHADPSGAIANAVACAVDGSTVEAIDALREIRDPKLRGRALQIVSAFLHEKRHFLDFVATNYGAFRFRQFLEVYTNLPAVLQTAKPSGRLCCPLEIYDDPVRSSLMNLSDIPGEFVAIAQMLARRRKMVEYDRKRVGTRYGPIEIGGEAQLEALAYLAQARFVTSFFGMEGAREFRDSLYNVDNFSEKYFAVIEAAARVGLLPFRAVEKSDKTMVLDTALLEASLFASLQSDYVPASKKQDYFESSYPGERFAALSMKILEDHPKIAERDPGAIGLEEAWELVDKTCEKVFGRSVADQIELDITYFEKQSSEKIYGNVPDDIETVCRDYLALRRHVLDRFRDSPTSIASTEVFVFSTAEQVIPNYVICANSGQLGDPPEGYNRLMGYHEPDRDVERAPYLKWWWACSPDHSNTEIFSERAGKANDQIRFAHPKSWYSCIDFYSPTAKLLMNGRRIRTMLGPELMFAERRLETHFGVKAEIFPSFEFPDETIDPGVFYFYYGCDSLKCDLSSATIDRPNGNVLTPWTLRRWPRLAKHVIQELGGHELAYFTFVRDWSAWIVSDAVFVDLQILMSSDDDERRSVRKSSIWNRIFGGS